MKFVCTNEVKEYLKQKKKDTIIVEVITSEHSDFEVSEIHTFAADAKRANFYVDKKNYTRIETEFGFVLMPKYKLEIDETIEFSMKKVLFLKWITQKGIRL